MTEWVGTTNVATTGRPPAALRCMVCGRGLDKVPLAVVPPRGTQRFQCDDTVHCIPRKD